MSPYRIAPAVPLLMRFAHRLFVDGDPETGLGGDRQEAIDRRQHVGIGDEVEQIVADIVVDAERHFLNRDIGRAGGELQAAGQRERTERAMRGDRNVIGFGDGGDLAALEQPARVTEVGLDNVDRPAFEKRLEVPA